MSPRFPVFILSAILFLGPFAQARVFDITKENFASYILFNGGPGTINKTAFENESGSSVTFDNQYSYNYGGEFGFLYATPAVNLRFGLEVIKPQSLKDVTATSGSGTPLYTMSSDILGFAPKLGVEINLKRMPNYRVFFVMSAGMGNIIMKNEYVLTQSAKATYGITDHTAESKGSATMYSAAVGAEILLTDTTTFTAEAGYRSLKFDSLTYSKATDTFSGSKNAGDPVTDFDGNKRSLDFSGMLFIAGLRFYL